jgi:hypothetical protein
MKYIVRSFIFHIITIIIFTILYYLFSDHYTKSGKKFEDIDYILLSVTIQAGVGISDIHPTTFYGKLILILQQLLMITTHIFTLYFFTI